MMTCWVVLVALVFNPTPGSIPSAPPPSHHQPGLTFQPRHGSIPLTPGAGPDTGLTFRPPPPLTPPVTSPVPSPEHVPDSNLRCRCLTWKYPKHPELSHFRVLLSPVSGEFTKAKTQAQQAAVPDLVLSLSCDTLHLFTNGRYYLVAQAVGFSEELSDYSNEVCIEVKDRVVYGCDQSDMGKGAVCK